MGRVSWPVVVRLNHIENATVADAGSFARASIAPVPLPPAITRWLATFCVNTTDRVVALTYDDGPHPEHTPKILEVLAARRASATFFVLAPQVERHPQIARRIVAEGHELALHGADHRSLVTRRTREALRVVRDAKVRVEAVVGRRVRLFRPPYGDYTWPQAVGLRLLGLELVVWSGDSRDWLHDGETAIAERAVAGSFPGSVVLMHDNVGDPEAHAERSAPAGYDRSAALRSILDALDAQGTSTSTVSGLFASHQRVRSVARYGSARTT